MPMDQSHSHGCGLTPRRGVEPIPNKKAGSPPHMWPQARAVHANLGLIGPFTEQAFSVLHTVAESRGEEFATWSKFG